MKVQLTILCGPERGSWINPFLHIGVGQWSHDTRIETFVEKPSYGYFTSQEARNVACERFMADEQFGPTDCLMMVDNDTNPVNPKSGIMGNLMDLPLMGLPIVGCPVSVIFNNEWMLNAMYEEGDSWRPMSLDELSKPANDKLVITDAGPAVKVDAIGFGVVCIQKQVLQRMEEQEIFQVEDGGKTKAWGLWKIPSVVRWRDDRGATIKGEDFLFCKRAKELGFQTHVSPHHYCGHLHTIDFGKLNQLKFAIAKKPKTPTAADYHITGPCPPITEWAIEPVLADWICIFLRQRTETHILELGSGVSTVMMDQHRGKGSLFSIEHDEEWASKVRPCLQLNWATIFVRELEDGFYNLGPFDIYPGGCDLMLVDGPPANLAPFGRVHASRWFHLLKKGAIIILDDVDRDGEKMALSQWISAGEVEAVERVGRAAILRKL